MRQKIGMRVFYAVAMADMGACDTILVKSPVSPQLSNAGCSGGIRLG